MIYFDFLEKILKGKVLNRKENKPVEYLIIDSRKSISSPYALFFAIKGSHHDGHDFIPSLFNQGINQFIVEDTEKIPEKVLNNSNVFKVKSSVEALQKIAGYKRQEYSKEVLAITGSNGKTIIKEWLHQLLSADLNLIRSPKSYNSQVGVPLSLWQINKHYDLAVIEAGISKSGEMARLQKIIKPTTGIFTNLGPAHDQGFENMQHKANEKAKLFSESELVIYCKDYEEIDKALKELKKPELFSWSEHKEADIRVISAERELNKSKLKMKFGDHEFKISIPYSDLASIENAIHCIAYMLYRQYEVDDIRKRLNVLAPVSMRLEMKQGINNCHLIDDSYNNDVGGLDLALDFLNQQSKNDKSMVILSDVLQSNLPEEELYKNIAELLKRKNINKLIGIGPAISRNYKWFNTQSRFYPSTDDFLERVPNTYFQHEMILVKGARPFGFEKIIKRLQQKLHSTVLEIDLGAITHNLNFYRSKLKPETKIMVMVKALAYGSGSYEVANLLQFHRVDYLGVAYADEGVNLREKGIHIPIMVMNPNEESFEKIHKYRLEPEIYNLSILNKFLEFSANKNHQKVPVHIKLDTGMHRLGFEEYQIEDLIKSLKSSQNLEVKSIFTHLAGQDDEIHNEFTVSQVEKFNQIANRIEKVVDDKPLRHALNSAGILRFPEYHFDMVRLGIGLYGIEANDMEQEKLVSISTLKTVISQIREVKKGESVGYDRKGAVSKDSIIATIPIGYADGFSRSFSNGKGFVKVNGKKASVIGNVCMDMTMIDVTGIDAKEGDEVIIFGSDPTIKELADSIGTIPYEIFTNVSERVKRVYISE